MNYCVKRCWQVKEQNSCIILIFHSDKDKENIKTFLDDEGLTGIQVTQLGQGLGIVLGTMTILTILKDYSDFSNFILQKGAEGICESTCVSAVWER